MWNAKAIKTPFGHSPSPLKDTSVLQTIIWQVLREVLLPSGNKVYPVSTIFSNTTALFSWKSHFLPWLPVSLILKLSHKHLYRTFWELPQVRLPEKLNKPGEKRKWHHAPDSLSVLIAQCLIVHWNYFKNEKLGKAAQGEHTAWAGSRALSDPVVLSPLPRVALQDNWNPEFHLQGYKEGIK